MTLRSTDFLRPGDASRAEDEAFSAGWMEAARVAVLPRFRHLDGGHPLVERLIHRAALDWLRKRGPGPCSPGSGPRP